MNPTAASAMIQTLKGITIILNVGMFLVLVYFASGLKWRNEKDRASVIGFGIMIATCALSVICIMIS